MNEEMNEEMNETINKATKPNSKKFMTSEEREIIKKRNLDGQRKFKESNPYYNAYLMYKRRVKKRDNPMEEILTYEEFCNLKKNNKGINLNLKKRVIVKK